MEILGVIKIQVHVMTFFNKIVMGCIGPLIGWQGEG